MAAGYRRRQLRGRREAKQGVRRRQLRGRHAAKQGAKGREVIGAREAQQVKTVRWRGLAMSGSTTRQQTTAITASVESSFRSSQGAITADLVASSFAPDALRFGMWTTLFCRTEMPRGRPRKSTGACVTIVPWSLACLIQSLSPEKWPTQVCCLKGQLTRRVEHQRSRMRMRMRIRMRVQQ